MSSSKKTPGACPTCGSLPPSYLRQSGYGESFPAAANALVPLELDNRHDVWRCPDCGDLFAWEDNSQLYGSGNLDEERLDRLTEAQAQSVRALLAPDFLGTPPDDLIEAAARELPRDLLLSILRHLVYHAKTLEPLVPALAALLVAENEQPLVTVLLDWAGRQRIRLQWVIEMIERGGRPSSRFGEVLRKIARERLEALPG